MPNPRFSAILLVAVAAMAVASAVFTYGLLIGSRTVNNQGNVNAIGVGVYWEAACATEVSIIDWDFMEPGSNKSVTVYIRNEGSVPMTLSMTDSNWDPVEASTHLALSWDSEGSTVNAQSVHPANLTLTVSPSINGVTSFSFDITITGVE